MTREIKSICAIAYSFWCATAFAQGTFQNLDFEDANPVPYGYPYPGAYMTAASALPGWNTSVGSLEDTPVVLDGLSTGGAEISLISDNPSDGTTSIQGNYCVFLFSGGPLLAGESASISQTATVPAGAESIQFDVGDVGGPAFVVTLGGTPIDMVSLQGFTQYELWGGNIPATMAGKPETLTITEPGTPSEEGGVELDDIVFSPNPVTVTPEPDAVTLMSIGGVLFGLYRRIQVSRKC